MPDNAVCCKYKKSLGMMESHMDMNIIFLDMVVSFRKTGNTKKFAHIC